jgi:hypothetical protein
MRTVSAALVNTIAFLHSFQSRQASRGRSLFTYSWFSRETKAYAAERCRCNVRKQRRHCMMPCTGLDAQHARSHANIAQTPPEPDTLGGWWPQAELVDRSLPAYTPAPSNPSFMGAFVPMNGNGCLFSGEASGLDAFSPYPLRRGCPATALSNNRLTRGHSVPFLSY